MNDTQQKLYGKTMARLARAGCIVQSKYKGSKLVATGDPMKG